MENTSLSCQEMVALCFRLRTWSRLLSPAKTFPGAGSERFTGSGGGGRVKRSPRPDLEVNICVAQLLQEGRGENMPYLYVLKMAAR